MTHLILYSCLAIIFTGCTPHNIVIDRYETGEPSAKWRYVDGLKQGESTLYNTHGEPYFVATFKKGKMTGTSREYTYFNGEKQLALRYECLNDHCKGYSPQNNLLINEISFNNGVPHGEAIYYYSTGERHIVVNYLDGKREGEENEYYRSGQPKTVTTFIAGETNGDQHSYYASGSLKRTSTIKPQNGYYVHFHAKEYYEGGSLKLEEISNGDGARLYQREYSRQGALVKELDYQNKITRTYGRSGEITSEVLWKK